MIPRTYRQAKIEQAKAKERHAKRREKCLQVWGIDSLLTNGALKHKLWALVSEFIRLRDKTLYGPLCRICGRRPIQCAYHLVPSGDGAAVRYDPENIVAACHPCNFGEKEHRMKYLSIHEGLFGKEKMDRLRAKADTMKQYSRTDFLLMIQDFKRRIQERDFVFPAEAGGGANDDRAS